MEMLYLYEKDGRKRKAVESVCKICNKKFLQRADKYGENHKKTYCSSECSSLSQRNRIIIKCPYCKKDFEIVQSKIDKGKYGINFCSRKCRDSAMRLNSGIDGIIRPPHYGTAAQVPFRDLISRYNLQLKCVSCGESRSFLLQCHHKDGNHKNNIIENLEIVCNNCHVIRHLYQSENNEWLLNFSVLTPRNSIEQFYK